MEIIKNIYPNLNKNLITLSKQFFILLLLISIGINNSIAQSLRCSPANLELGNVAGTLPPAGTAHTTNAQTFTFINDAANNNTFSSFTTPTTTVTFSLSNQQFTSIAGATGPNGLAFGSGAGYPYSEPLNYLSSPAPSTLFTSTNTGATGVGINSTTTATATSNMGVALDVVSGIGNPISGSAPFRPYYGDLTVTFNNPVDNPILHFADFGGAGSNNIAAQFQIISGQTMTKLSGSAAVTLSGDTIKATVASYSSASIQINGLGVTTVKFKVFLLGNTSNFSAGDDLLIISASVPTSVPPAPVPSVFTAQNVCPSTTIDLTSIQPAPLFGTTLEWHTVANNPTPTDLVTTPTAVTAGTSYLYAKNISTGCYSLASNPVVVTTASCNVNVNCATPPFIEDFGSTNTQLPNSQSTADPQWILSGCYNGRIISNSNQILNPNTSAIVFNPPTITLDVQPPLEGGTSTNFLFFGTGTTGNPSNPPCPISTYTVPAAVWKNSATINLIPGETYIYSYYARLENTTNPPSLSQQVIPATGAVTVISSTSNALVTTGWVQNSLTFTVSAATTAIFKINTSVATGAPGTDFGIDNIVISAKPPVPVPIKAFLYSSCPTASIDLTTAQPAAVPGYVYQWLDPSNMVVAMPTSVTVSGNYTLTLKSIGSTCATPSATPVNVNVANCNFTINCSSAPFVEDFGVNDATLPFGVSTADAPYINNATCKNGYIVSNTTPLTAGSGTQITSGVTGAANDHFLFHFTANLGACGYAAGDAAWKSSATINLVPGVCYQYSYYARLEIASGAPNLTQVVVPASGTISLITPNTTNPLSTGVWTKNTMTFTTSTATSVTLRINTNGTSGIGNDFAIDSISLGVCPAPALVIAPITGVTMVCVGSAIQLVDATPSGIWSSKYTPIATTNGTGMVTGVAPGMDSIYYKLTNTNGCADSVVYKVTVNPLPAVTITPGGPTTFCSGGSVSLALIATTCSGCTYQWKLNGTNIGGATSATYSATQSGIYTAMVTSSAGCTATSTGTMVTINPLPTSVISNGATVSTSCGSNALLTANTNGCATTTFQWYKNGVLISGATASTYAATPPMTGSDSYTVLITDCNGCSNTSAATQVLAPPTIGANGSQAICQGGSVVLTATPVFPTNFYQWKLNGTPIGGANNVNYTANTAGNYTCTVTDGGVGSATTCPIVVSVYLNPTPSIVITGSSSVCAGNAVSLAANATPYASYQWLLGGNPIMGATSNTYTATQSGSYTLQVTNAPGGCIGTSAATLVTIESLPAAPLPNTSSLTNICPATTVDLTAIQPSPQSGTLLEWHTASSNPSALNVYSTPASAATGTYYLYAKGSAPNSCFSLASVPVVVTINFCSKPVPDVNTTFAGVPVTGNVATNDIVPAGSTYGTPIPVGGNPLGGVITMNPNGTYTFSSPNPGVYYFQVPLCAPTQMPPCPTVELKITVLDANSIINPPVANTDIATTSINTPVTLKTFANDKASNSGATLVPSSVMVTIAPAHGTTSVNAATGDITYTPNTGFVGTDTLTYTVCDNSTPTPLCAIAQQIITVLPSGAPNSTVATDDYNTTVTGTNATGNLLTNDNDPQGNTQMATPQTTTIPGKGTLTLLADGSYTFVPAPGFSGPVNFPYKVCDNGTPPACDSATLYILVSPAPKLVPDVNVTNVNVPVGGSVATNDNVPPGTTYGTPAALPGNPSAAMPMINPNGTYTFTSATPGVYKFKVPVCSPPKVSPNCDSSLLTITVLDPAAATNPPVANTDIATTSTNTSVTLKTLANDKASNPAANLDPASVMVTTAPAHGTTSVNAATGDITYTPNPGFVGIDTLTYTVCDNSTPTPFCTTAQQIITVLQSGAPNSTVATDDYNTTVTGTNATGNLLTNDSDPQGDSQMATPQTTSISGKGTLTLLADGSYTFVPAPGFTGPVEFPYTVCDNGTPTACTNATLHILVGSISILPINLVSFTKSTVNCLINLSWGTSSETNLRKFEIEKSFDGSATWQLIGSVMASGNSSLLKQYQFSDIMVSGKLNLYRLKMFDIDGKLNYSPIVSAKCNTSSLPITIMPNPANDKAIIVGVELGNIVRVFTEDGKEILKTRAFSNSIQLNMMNWLNGIYFISVWNDKTNQQSILKLVKQ